MSVTRPAGMAFDEQGRLYVADAGAHRVVVYDPPLRRGMREPDFSRAEPNQGGFSPGATTLKGPAAVALDGHGHLLVADSGNDRVLIYQLP